MLEQYQEAIALLNDLLSNKGKDREIEELKQAISEFEKELRND